MPRSSFLLGFALGLSLCTACSASSRAGQTGQGGSANPGGGAGEGGVPGGGPGDQAGSAGAGVGGGFATGAGTGTGGSSTACDTPSGTDDDGDGFSEDEGDCNDCDKNVNPGAVEVVDNTPDMNGNIPDPADEDCDGQIDNVLPLCDDGLAIDDANPLSGAKAIDLCQEAMAGDKKWGVLEARYLRADGTAAVPPKPEQWGLMSKFGPNVNVQRGKSMLALSSGHARAADDPSPCQSLTCIENAGGTAPPDFPQDVPGCQGAKAINDDVALQLKVRAPTNATGYSFSFKFYSFEFPKFVCTKYNDQFIALVDPPPMGSINGNISFDSKTNPVSVNIAFFDVCDPASSSMWAIYCSSGSCPPVPSPYCPSGPAGLQGTGFAEWNLGTYAGATSWLKTQAPVGGGDEITIRFAIWDTGDQQLDSTALIDDFEWIANGGTVGVGTTPIPDPK